MAISAVALSAWPNDLTWFNKTGLCHGWLGPPISSGKNIRLLHSGDSTRLLNRCEFPKWRHLGQFPKLSYLTLWPTGWYPNLKIHCIHTPRLGIRVLNRNDQRWVFPGQTDSQERKSSDQWRHTFLPLSWLNRLPIEPNHTVPIIIIIIIIHYQWLLVLSTLPTSVVRTSPAPPSWVTFQNLPLPAPQARAT